MEINDKFQLKEPVIHGNDIFPINVYNNIKVNNKQLFLYHWHNEVEFLHLREGEATFYLDTNPIVLKKGEFIFINSGIVHSGYSKNYLDCSFDAIVFDTNILNSNTTGISQNKYISPFLNKKSIIPNKYTKETDWGIEVIKSLNFIIKEFNSRKKGYELAVNGAL
ncbi:MAG: cupin domain-containing protein, partial [Clostridiales bacterium]